MNEYLESMCCNPGYHLTFGLPTKASQLGCRYCCSSHKMKIVIDWGFIMGGMVFSFIVFEMALFIVEVMVWYCKGVLEPSGLDEVVLSLYFMCVYDAYSVV